MEVFRDMTVLPPTAASSTAKRALRLHEADTVAVAIDALAPGDPLSPDGPTARDPIPVGHKAALAAIATGAPIVKYGQIIAVASRAIEPGEHVHTHNAVMPAYSEDYDVEALEEVPPEPPIRRRTFPGYLRDDGRVGTRNYLGVVATVNCSATVAKRAAERVQAELEADPARFPNVDGVIAIMHGTGCGLAGAGEALRALQRTLWGYITHPNMAGVVLVGLGCEVNQVALMLDGFGLADSPRFKAMTIQEEGGTRRTVERIVDEIRAMLPIANAAERSPQSVAHLTLALQCGGSDGYSGLTANPALGAAVDRLVEHGGAAILSETPEIYGAEHLLIRRAASPAVARKLVERIRWWEDYTAKLGGSMDNNPTPGNKAGGLTTILEKSLGAVAKGGSKTLRGVYRYAERLEGPGFAFMDSPGFDPCSITGQVASGANVICFTTGRGSVYGNKPVPSLKLATNTPMFRRLEEDMDIDCGVIVSEGRSVEAVGDAIFDLIVETAAGARSKSEINGLGDCEFVPWMTGAVM